MIYLAIKYHPDHKNRSLIENINLACENEGEVCVCIAKDVEKWGEVQFCPQALMEISFDKITKSKLILIEFSEKGVGIGIEAGYAHALNLPIYVIHPFEIEVSNTLIGIATAIYPYENYKQIPQVIQTILQHYRTNLLYG